jgi:hypothetical protein
MATQLGGMTLDETARQAAGNWRLFQSFCWHRRYDLDDPDQWAVIYTHNRDSTLLEESNAAAIAAAMERFTEGDDPDVVFESHSHWLVGHVDGFSLKVFRNGVITEAFRMYHGLTERLATYPILDEEDYSRRESEALLGNIADAAWRLRHQYHLPDGGWEGEVASWLWDHDQRAVENRDDRGGYPEESSLVAAFEALGYERAK